MKTVCGLVFALLLAINAYPSISQDTIGLPTPDTIAPAARLMPSPKRIFPVRSFLLPATLIAYGITTIGNEELKEINVETREELWVENSHRQMHLDNYLQWAPAAAVYGLNAVGIKGAHNFRDRTIIYGLSTLIMSATVYAGKNISNQVRPDATDHFSFPSGHTATAFAGAEFLRREYKDVSPWYGVAGYAMAATTGYLRMYNNKHWLSDVVAGAGVGILSTNLAYYLYPTVKRIFVKDKGGATVATPFYNQGVFGVSLVHQF